VLGGAVGSAAVQQSGQLPPLVLLLYSIGYCSEIKSRVFLAGSTHNIEMLHQSHTPTRHPLHEGLV